MFVFLGLMLMLMLMRKREQHKTNKWVRSSYVSASAYAYVAGVLTCYVCDNQPLASTTGSATTKPQIKNLIGRIRKNKRAASAARTLEQFRAVFCKTTT